MEVATVKQEEVEKSSIESSIESQASGGRECREDNGVKRGHSADDRDEMMESKGKAPIRSKCSAVGGSRKGSRSNYAHNNKMSSRGGSYAPHLRAAGPPYAPPPPYAYMGSSYAPPPPPHYHHPPHMAMPPYGGAPFGSHMGAMKGHSFPPHHHYPGPPYGMPPTYPHQPPTVQSAYPTNIPSSDSASITSKGSISSKKKRTIDGVQNTMQNIYSFRRTDSNSSNASTLTTGNNTSMETTQTEDSPRRPESDGISVLNMDSMVFDDRYNSGSQNHGERHHRRSGSAASTASSLSVCGFSLASYEGRGGKCKIIKIKSMCISAI